MIEQITELIFTDFVLTITSPLNSDHTVVDLRFSDWYIFLIVRVGDHDSYLTQLTVCSVHYVKCTNFSYGLHFQNYRQLSCCFPCTTSLLRSRFKTTVKSNSPDKVSPVTAVAPRDLLHYSQEPDIPLYELPNNLSQDEKVT